MKKVTLVIKNDDILDILSQLFIEIGGWKVQCFRNGQEAIRNGPMEASLVIADVFIGVKIESFLEAMRSNYPQLPVILTSGRLTERDINGSLDENTKFISKPFPLERITKALVDFKLS